MELKTSGFGSICVRPIEMLPVNRMRVALLRDGFFHTLVLKTITKTSAKWRCKDNAQFQVRKFFDSKNDNF